MITKGIYLLIKLFLSKLYWQTFSTKQIHQFLMAYPNVIKEGGEEKKIVIYVNG